MAHCLVLTAFCFVLFLVETPRQSHAFSFPQKSRSVCLVNASSRRELPICHEGYKWFPTVERKSELEKDKDEPELASVQLENSETVEGMGNLIDFIQVDSKSAKDEGSPPFLLLGGATFLAAIALAAKAADISLGEIVGGIDHFLQNPGAALEGVTSSISSMGVMGPVYFGFFYTIAELLAIPATPLTMSAGYLFGVPEGTLLVLTSASIAASISFVVGKTVLRRTVERILDDYPKFKKIDRAIAKEGFKLMFILRLSPVFPFALSNYLYGASSIDFSSYFWGTLLGFAPGTLAYVYTGMVGKALTIGGDGSQPWYLYAAGLALFAGVMKILADIASGIVDELDDEE